MAPYIEKPIRSEEQTAWDQQRSPRSEVIDEHPGRAIVAQHLAAEGTRDVEIAIRSEDEICGSHQWATDRELA